MEVAEKLTRLVCPTCGGHESLQLEETALYVTPITRDDDTGEPFLDYDSGEVHWSECGVTAIKRTDGNFQLACYQGDDCPAWDPPQWVLDALAKNSEGKM